MTTLNCDITERLREIGEEELPVMVSLINMFSSQYSELNDDITSNIKEKSPQRTKDNAHTLKGVCLNLGIDPMAETCKSIEDAALTNDWEQTSNLHKILNQQYNEAAKTLEELITEFS